MDILKKKYGYSIQLCYDKICEYNLYNLQKINYKGIYIKLIEEIYIKLIKEININIEKYSLEQIDYVKMLENSMNNIESLKNKNIHKLCLLLVKPIQSFIDNKLENIKNVELLSKMLNKKCNEIFANIIRSKSYSDIKYKDVKYIDIDQQWCWDQNKCDDYTQIPKISFISTFPPPPLYLNNTIIYRKF